MHILHFIGPFLIHILLKDRFNENNEDDMYAWGGTTENLHEHQQQQQQQQFESYQNNNGITNKANKTLLNIDNLIAANSRQYYLNKITYINYNIS